MVTLIKASDVVRIVRFHLAFNPSTHVDVVQLGAGEIQELHHLCPGAAARYGKNVRVVKLNDHGTDYAKSVHAFRALMERTGCLLRVDVVR